MGSSIRSSRGRKGKKTIGRRKFPTRFNLYRPTPQSINSSIITTTTPIRFYPATAPFSFRENNVQRRGEGECYSIPIHPSRELFFCERRRRERERKRELLPFSVFVHSFLSNFPLPLFLRDPPRSSPGQTNFTRTYSPRI